MIHSRTLRERFYGREIYISLNKNDKNVISRINCVTGSVGTLSRSRLDYTLAVDERFTLDTRGWSGIEYLCWTRKSPVPKIRPGVCCVSVWSWTGYNLWTFISSLKNENYTTYLIRWLRELHELRNVKCSVQVFCYCCCHYFF